MSEAVERLLAVLLRELGCNVAEACRRYRAYPEVRAAVNEILAKLPPVPGERLLTKAAAARALGVSAKTIGRWVKKGKIRARRAKPGGTGIPRSEILRLAEERRWVKKRKRWKRKKRKPGRERWW